MEYTPRIPDPDFFTNPRVRAIYETLGAARDLGFVHRQAERYEGRTIQISGQEYLNFSTCSYLAVERDPRLVAGVQAEAERFGAAFSISRAYASALPYQRFTEQLETIFGAPVVVTPSCTLGHFAFMSAMIQPGDVLILDAQVHNSVQMAATSAFGARVLKCLHNDMDQLEAMVRELADDADTNHIWYFGDGIYSMYGDVAPVDRLVEMMDRYAPFYVYLDDAHGTSTQGKHGRGYVLDQMEQIHPKLVVVASFSKSFGLSCGSGMIVPHESWRDVIQTCGATMLFSSPIPPPMLGAGIASADIHLSDEMDGMLAELHERIAVFQEEARHAGLTVLSDARSPVQYVLVGALEEAFRVVGELFEAGFWVNVCGYPVVPKDRCGVRMTITRHVTPDDVRALVAAIAEAVAEAPVPTRPAVRPTAPAFADAKVAR